MKGKSRRPFLENYEKTFKVVFEGYAKHSPLGTADVCCGIQMGTKEYALFHWKKYHKKENKLMKITLIVVGFMLISLTLKAQEYPRNPDRFPSFGLNYSNSMVKGDSGSVSTSETLVGSENLKVDTIGLDVRIPVSNQITVSAAYEMIDGGRTSSIRNLSQSFTNLDGYKASFGVRFYLNEKKGREIRVDDPQSKPRLMIIDDGQENLKELK